MDPNNTTTTTVITNEKEEVVDTTTTTPNNTTTTTDNNDETSGSSSTSSVITNTTTKIVSAPGKMLLVGGYLVLDETNIGLVIGVNARFYSKCTIIYTTTTTTGTTTTTTNTTNTSLSSSKQIVSIHVLSSQFQQEWYYDWDCSTMTLMTTTSTTTQSTDDQDVSQQQQQKKNPFLEKALRVALLYIYHPKNTSNNNNTSKIITNINIELMGDNDFYSLMVHLQDYSLNKYQIHQLPKCLLVKKDPMTNDVYKTGLGSSACLVSSIIGSIIYTYYDTNSITSNTSDTTTTTSIIKIIERLSQIGHCYAQGKIGSGFDVSAAIYGSHIYQRFIPSILGTILQLLDTNSNNSNCNNTDITTTTTTTQEVLYDLVHDNPLWVNSGLHQEPIQCFAYNTFLQVMMADVCGGSESPSMAKQILHWKASYDTTNTTYTTTTKIPHWDDLILYNRQIIDTLQQIHSIVPVVHEDDTKLIELQKLYSSTPRTEWMNVISKEYIVLTELLLQLQNLFIQQRYHMKHMGIIANHVPIEPDIQTTLCNDVTHHINGVLATLVPGAGGYDAISIIYINCSTVQTQIIQYISEYTTQNICPLSVQGVSYGDGLRIETTFPLLSK